MSLNTHPLRHRGCINYNLNCRAGEGKKWSICVHRETIGKEQFRNPFF